MMIQIIVYLSLKVMKFMKMNSIDLRTVRSKASYDPTQTKTITKYKSKFYLSLIFTREKKRGTGKVFPVQALMSVITSLTT